MLAPELSPSGRCAAILPVNPSMPHGLGTAFVYPWLGAPVMKSRILLLIRLNDGDLPYYHQDLRQRVSDVPFRAVFFFCVLTE